MSLDAKNLYLEALAKIITKVVDKEMHTKVFRCSKGCRNNQPNQPAHYYCNELDPRKRANDCFDVAFTKVHINLANELCFETVSPRIPIPV